MFINDSSNSLTLGSHFWRINFGFWCFGYMAFWMVRFSVFGFWISVYSYMAMWILGYWIFGLGLIAIWLISINSSNGGSSGSGDGDGEFKLLTCPYETIHTWPYRVRNKHVNYETIGCSCSWIRIQLQLNTTQESNRIWPK